jgi:hypothetical protein
MLLRVGGAVTAVLSMISLPSRRLENLLIPTPSKKLLAVDKTQLGFANAWTLNTYGILTPIRNVFVSSLWGFALRYD